MPIDHDQTRRTFRIPAFDYAQPGAYFITVCAHRRREIFGKIENTEVNLSSIGQLIDKHWRRIPIHHHSISIDEYVIMPNHLHGILIIHIPCRGTIHRAPTRTEGFGSPVPGSIPTIIRTFKAAVTRQWRRETKDPTFTVWQRNYYERVIRDDF
jgi:REP element-mobilizing transposase RayT